ncbi:hypothetical protein A9Q02_23105 [Candidatus Chloroploca asiatica]|uniref:Uncharacterized protein n=2 Tax=Candidatus Chloroploca asiatica TaxID=1506545 RepID=A0A2H3L5G4_9CHLR|nr:hypothetical protein A9Q02_23105 [Candidatus Chloroploca asiatica]
MKLTHRPRITAHVCHVPGDPGAGLTELADALLVMTAVPELAEAFRIAHQFTSVEAQRQTRRRTMAQAAETLRTQLAALTAHLGEAA